LPKQVMIPAFHKNSIYTQFCSRNIAFKNSTNWQNLPCFC